MQPMEGRAMEVSQAAAGGSADERGAVRGQDGERGRLALLQHLQVAIAEHQQWQQQQQLLQHQLMQQQQQQQYGQQRELQGRLDQEEQQHKYDQQRGLQGQWDQEQQQQQHYDQQRGMQAQWNQEQQQQQLHQALAAGQQLVLLHPDGRTMQLIQLNPDAMVHHEAMRDSQLRQYGLVGPAPVAAAPRLMSSDASSAPPAPSRLVPSGPRTTAEMHQMRLGLLGTLAGGQQHQQQHQQLRSGLGM